DLVDREELGFVVVEAGRAADQEVIAGPAVDLVGARAANDEVAALARQDVVVAGAAEDHIVAVAALKAVVAAAAEQPRRDADAAGDLDVVIASLPEHLDPRRAGEAALRHAVDQHLHAVAGIQDDIVVAGRAANGQELSAC